jgi:acetyl esterase/lipase
MARRPEVATAPLPVAVVDTVVLAQQMVAALWRVPFRNPLRGTSNPVSNLGASVTREVLRTFMGFSSSLPIDEFRSIELMLDDLCHAVMPPVVAQRGVHGSALTLGCVPGMLYRPREGKVDGVIVYMHGGGYIGTSPSMYAFFTARLARETNCAVFVADYRLAPEFPFPAGVEDADAVMTALQESYGVPADRMILAGDSGGGGLANSWLLLDPDRVQGKSPAAVVLFSPEVDLVLDEPSVTDNAPYDILPWNIPTAAYLHGVDPTSSDVDAADADLSSFPPTYVVWGADEMFRDPIRRFVKRLDAAGVTYQAREVPGMFHVFPILMPWAATSQRVYRDVAHFVADVLADAPPLPDGVLELDD